MGRFEAARGGFLLQSIPGLLRNGALGALFEGADMPKAEEREPLPRCFIPPLSCSVCLNANHTLKRSRRDGGKKRESVQSQGVR